MPRAAFAMFILIGCGLWLLGLGLYFIFVRPALLPEDLRYIGASLDGIRSALPGFSGWLHRVFTVMGGFMIGTGALTILLSINESTARESSARKKWTSVVVALTGLVTVGTMTLTNFQLDSDFKWLLMIPTLLWGIGVGVWVSCPDQTWNP